MKQGLIVVLVFLFSLLLRMWPITVLPEPSIKEVRIQLAAEMLSNRTLGEIIALFQDNFFVVQTEKIAPFPIFLWYVLSFRDHNPETIRAATAIIGSLTVALFLLCVGKLFLARPLNKRQIDLFLFISGLVLAGSPWLIQLNRADFAMTISLFFINSSLLLSIINKGTD